MFIVQLENISFTWRRKHCRWRAAISRPHLGAYGLWALSRERFISRFIRCNTGGPRFSSLVRKIVHLVALHDKPGIIGIYSNPNPEESWIQEILQRTNLANKIILLTLLSKATLVAYIQKICKNTLHMILIFFFLPEVDMQFH